MSDFDEGFVFVFFPRLHDGSWWFIRRLTSSKVNSDLIDGLDIDLLLSNGRSWFPRPLFSDQQLHPTCENLWPADEKKKGRRKKLSSGQTNNFGTTKTRGWKIPADVSHPSSRVKLLLLRVSNKRSSIFITSSSMKSRERREEEEEEVGRAKRLFIVEIAAH